MPDLNSSELVLALLKVVPGVQKNSHYFACCPRSRIGLRSLPLPRQRHFVQIVQRTFRLVFFLLKLATVFSLEGLGNVSKFVHLKAKLPLGMRLDIGNGGLGILLPIGVMQWLEKLPIDGDVFEQVRVERGENKL